MTLHSNWDVGLIVFLGIMTAYSFIIGKKQSVKVMIGSYVAMIATQGMGNILLRLMGQSQAALQVMGIAELNLTVLALAKIFIFCIFIIVFSIRSGVEVTYTKNNGSAINMIYTGVFGVSTGCLIAAAVITYALGGAPLQPGTIPFSAIEPFTQKSPLILTLILNQDIFFALPALLLMGVGFMNK